MPEIGTFGLMSGDGKRTVAEWPKLPRPSSTLPTQTCPHVRDEVRLWGVSGQAAESAMESRLGGLLKGWQLRLWARGGMMRLMPYTIEVR